jgi:hypothetical protein
MCRVKLLANHPCCHCARKLRLAIPQALDLGWGRMRLRAQSQVSSLICLDLGLPVPLAGALVLPPVRSQAAGHAWLSLDTHCHLHYEVLLAGLGGSEQGTVTAHLLGPPGMPGPQRLLKGFYGSEVKS